MTDFEVIVVDNSGTALVKTPPARGRVITNSRNVGFGAAINQVWRDSQSPFIASLNDDAVAQPQWLEALLRDAERHPEAGMFASQVRLPDGNLDSAGMLISADGSSKQRGHGQSSQAKFDEATLFPSGSAALYRREMLDQTGGFDESFFLYCEDVDLGLRARWLGWDCRYVAEAQVEHRYSHSAGRASVMKAYYVERNRLYTILKTFPLSLLARAPWAALTRYFWHLVSILAGRGKAAEFRKEGQSAVLLPFLVLRAHVSAVASLPRLLGQRREILAKRRLSTQGFRELLRHHAISVREVASL